MVNLEEISFDQCLKCTVCTAYCPVAKANPLYMGPKQSGPDQERLRQKNPEMLDASIKACTNCKTCEIHCPSNVKIADYIAKAKYELAKKKGYKLRDRILSSTDLLGTLNTTFSPIVNRVIALKPVKVLMDKFLEVPKERVFPKYEFGTFEKWFKKNAPDQSRFERKVVFFYGVFVNYNCHQLGKDLIKVLNALNIGVEIVDEKCSGVAFMANSFLDQAKENAQFNIASLGKAVAGTDKKVVFTSTSDTLAVKQEYHEVLGQDNSSIKDNLEYIARFLVQEFENGNTLKLNPINKTVAYHVPCHMQADGGAAYTIELLKKIPGLKVRVPAEQSCCGIAGTYGFKKENYEVSQRIASTMVENLSAFEPDYVVTDCETCKWQIEMSSPYEVNHPISMLAEALG